MFPLNWSMGLPEPPLFGRAAFEHEVTGHAHSTSHDDVLHDWNTQSSSQWDGFRHIRNGTPGLEPGTGHYGGVADEDHGIDHWARRGIAGRGVLADIARWRGVRRSAGRSGTTTPTRSSPTRSQRAWRPRAPRSGGRPAVRPHRLDRVVRAAAGRGAARAGGGERPAGARVPIGEALAETLWDLHVAAIACDNPAVEVWPPGALLSAEEEAAVRTDRSRLHEIFTHTLLLPLLGIPLGEMFVLEALADDCAMDGRYEFFVTSAPLNLPRGVASPPNALALK